MAFALVVMYERVCAIKDARIKDLESRLAQIEQNDSWRVVSVRASSDDLGAGR